MTPNDAELVNVRTAAAILGIRSQTLDVWRSTRRYPLAFFKIGRAVRYSRAELERFKQSREVREPVAAEG